MEQLFLTKLLHITNLTDGWKGLYNPFGHKIAFLFDEAIDFIKKGEFDKVSPKIIQYLSDNNFLVPKGFEEEWLNDKKPASDIAFTSMFLVTTLDCNFSCGYCAVIGNIDNKKYLSGTNNVMSKTVGRKAVALFERQLNLSPPKEARVTFYGGEPMLNQGLVADLIPLINKISYTGQQRPVECVMITNGYVYNSKLVDLFKHYKTGICVSLDGLEIHQNAARLLRSNGKSTFKRVVSTIEKYVSNGLSVGISTALGKHNYKDLQKICEFFVELGVKFIEFQIPYQVSNESNNYWVSTEGLTKNLMEVYKFLLSKSVIEGLGHRRVRDLLNGKIHFRDCGASGSQLVVAPDGSLGPCHSLTGKDKYFEGNVNDENINPKELKNFKEWASRFPLNMRECHSCPYISLCGGGCIYNSYIANKTIWGKDPQVCTYMKEMVDWVLKDTWKSTDMYEKYGIYENELA